jgi:hypothetical protein
VTTGVLRSASERQSLDLLILSHHSKGCNYHPSPAGLLHINPGTARVCPPFVAASAFAENLLARIIYKEQIPTLSNCVKGDRNDRNITFLNSKAFYCYDIGTSGSTIAGCGLRI